MQAQRCAWIMSLALLAGCAREGRGPGAAPKPSPPGYPYRGMQLVLDRLDRLEPYQQSLDQIAALGADSVLFIITLRSENATTTGVYLDIRSTPTPPRLGQIIQYARNRKLRVLLMPVLRFDHGESALSTLKPESWDEWFESYRSALGHLAWVAEGNKVDVFVVGSELTSAEEHRDQWRKTIAAVRHSFFGLLTYNANWDRYERIGFWEDLDLVGMNAYQRVGDTPNITADQAASAWERMAGPLGDFARSKGKPLILLDAGWPSVASAASDPALEDVHEPLDLDLQARLYDGFLRTWYGRPALGGLIIRRWAKVGPADRSASPQGKPAEKVLREWLARPRWQVSGG